MSDILDRFIFGGANKARANFSGSSGQQTLIRAAEKRNVAQAGQIDTPVIQGGRLFVPGAGGKAQLWDGYDDAPERVIKKIAGELGLDATGDVFALRTTLKNYVQNN